MQFRFRVRVRCAPFRFWGSLARKRTFSPASKPSLGRAKFSAKFLRPRNRSARLATNTASLPWPSQTDVPRSTKNLTVSAPRHAYRGAFRFRTRGPPLPWLQPAESVVRGASGNAGAMRIIGSRSSLPFAGTCELQFFPAFGAFFHVRSRGRKRCGNVLCIRYKDIPHLQRGGLYHVASVDS